MVLFIQAGNRWIVLAGVLLWAVGVSMGFPLGMSAAAESGPDPAARVSVVVSIGYFANLTGPPAIGLLAQSAGLLTPCGSSPRCSSPPSRRPAHSARDQPLPNRAGVPHPGT